MRLFLSAVAALCLLVSPALAQQAVDLNPVMSTVVAPLAVTILSGVASAVLALGFSWLRKKWGWEMEANDRAALHSALISGINLAVAKAGQTAGPIPRITVSNPITRMALEYALRAAPDAIRRFGLTHDKVEQMIIAKAQQVLGQTAPSVSPPVSS
ncbi:MAG: hypothetical protein H0U63_01130 [Burkholderiales bacterium]|nr:hypothetical protein [Burkholderiales bacterium]